MKVLICTPHQSHNFGAALQAYSLKKIISDMDNSVEFLNIGENPKQKSKKPAGKKGLLKLPSFLLNYKKLQISDSRFMSFQKKYLAGTKTYESYVAVENDPPNADIYMSGSDQVFIPTNILDKNFLRFAPAGKKRVSYAASLGVSNVPEQHKEKFYKYINDFDCLSIREEVGAELVRQGTEKNVERHIDPTFLTPADDYREIHKKHEKINTPYIFVYALYRPKWFNEELKKLHKKNRITYCSPRGQRWQKCLPPENDL